MGVTGDILMTYRSPRTGMRRQLAGGPREDRGIAILLAACGMLFVAQWPVLMRRAAIDPAVPFDALIAGALTATVFLLPLIAYGLAALAHLAARPFGGRGSFWASRRVLFWALLSVAPLQIAAALIGGLAGPGPVQVLIGLLVFGVFLAFWASGLRVAEFEGITTDAP